MTHTFLYKDIAEKSIVWFKNQNQYLILEDKTTAILKQLDNKISISEISKNLSDKLSIPYEATTEFIKGIHENLYLPNTIEKAKLKDNFANETFSDEFSITRFYKIGDLVFKVDFESEVEEFLIHPKFSHLSSKSEDHFNFHYQIFTKNECTFLIVDTKVIGSWNQDDIHYFQGKLSMMMIQNMHQKVESEWMGVFHASAVSNGKKSMLFLGDSGNGKSTSLALLQANGFTCLADDFVPIDIEKREVYSFPAAISIKKSSVPTLKSIYPELETSAEYHFKKLRKIVRFLEPNNNNFFNHLPCNDLIFIKYEKDSATICNEISKIEAFQQLVPDSWISPIEKNAQIFLDWFENLNCYQLTYSINSEMIATVTKLYDNDL